MPTKPTLSCLYQYPSGCSDRLGQSLQDKAGELFQGKPPVDDRFLWNFGLLRVHSSQRLRHHHCQDIEVAALRRFDKHLIHLRHQ